MTQFSEHKMLDMPSLDADIRGWWEAERVFERCGEARHDAPTFTFYEVRCRRRMRCDRPDGKMPRRKKP